MNKNHYENIANLYADLKNVQGIELLGYHDFGISKTDRLGLQSPIRFNKPSDDDIAIIYEFFKKTSNMINIIN